MFLPSVITSGLVAFTTSVPPCAVPTPPPPQALVDTLLRRDSSNTWTNSNICGWYSDVSSSAFHCGDPNEPGNPVGCHTNTDNVVGCTMMNDPLGSFYTTCVTSTNCIDGRCSNTDMKTLGCALSPMTKCASFYWTGSPIRSMFSCDSVDVIHSMLDEPAYLVAKPTESTPSSTSTSTSTISSDPPPPPPSTTPTTPPSSSPTGKSTSKKHTSSTTLPPSSSGQPTSSTPTNSPSSSESSPHTPASSSSSGDAALPTSKPDGSSPSSSSTSSYNTAPVGPPVVTTSTSTITAGPSSHPSPGVPSTPLGDTSGLSTGAKAGIGAGAGAGLLLLLTAVAFVLFKKRARQAAAEPVQHNVWPMYDRPRGPPPPRPERSPLPLHGRSPSLPGLWSRGNRDGRRGGGGGGDGLDDYDLSVGGSEVPVAREATSAHVAGGAHETGALGPSTTDRGGAPAGPPQGLPLRPPVLPRTDSRTSWRSERYPDSPDAEGFQHSSTRPARGNQLARQPPVSPAWRGQPSYATATGPSPTQQTFEPEDPYPTGGHDRGRHGGNRARGAV